MSAVERVRETARLMRERADVIESYAGEERWRHGDIGWDDRQETTWDVFADGGILVAAGAIEEVAEHIASLDPEVARRIADLLDAIANENDSPEGSRLAFLDFIDAPAMAAVSLADLYLGVEQ